MLAREQPRASFFSEAVSDKNRGPATTSLVWATLPILSTDPWLAGQSGTLFSVAELALAVAAVVRFRFAAATFVPRSAFLNVARFKLSAFLRIQVETRIAKCRFRLTPDGLTAQILSLAQHTAFCRAHPQPTLRVALEILPGCRRHCHPSITHALTCWPVRLTCRTVRRSRRRSSAGSMWLRLCGGAEQRERRQAHDQFT